MSTAVASPIEHDDAVRGSTGAVSALVSAAGFLAMAKLQHAVTTWADKRPLASGPEDADGPASPLTAAADAGLEKLAGSGGPMQAAGASAAEAVIHDENPIRAALKGAWREGSTTVRAAMITAAVGALLLAVLSPVLLIVYLLSLLILVAVRRTHEASAGSAT